MKKMMVAGLLTAMTAAASAQVYVGGAVGQTHINVDCSGAANCDNTDTGSKLYVGYQVNPQVAVEAAYIGFGKSKAQVWASGYLVNVDMESKGVLLAGAFRGALSPNFSLVGRLGLSFLKNKTTGSLLGYSDSESRNSVKPYAGLGIEYALTKNLRATAAADFTQATFEYDGVSDSGAVRNLNIGLQYNF